MLKYKEICGTNFFRVTDENKYKKIFSLLNAEDGVQDLKEDNGNGNIWHRFRCGTRLTISPEIYNNIDSRIDVKDDLYIWINMLQEILDERDVFIFYAMDTRKGKHLATYCIVASKTAIKSANLESNQLLGIKKLMRELVREVLNDTEHSTTKNKKKKMKGD